MGRECWDDLGSIQHATSDVHHALCIMQHPTYGMQRASCNVHHATFILHRATCVERFGLVEGRVSSDVLRITNVPNAPTVRCRERAGGLEQQLADGVAAAAKKEHKQALELSQLKESLKKVGVLSHACTPMPTHTQAHARIRARGRTHARAHAPTLL